MLQTLGKHIFDCKMQLSLGRQLKYIFTQDILYLHHIFNNITEQDTSHLDCKHKHMMKSGASPGKVRVLYRLLPIEFHGFTSRIDFKGSLWFLVLSQFLETVWVPLDIATIE